MDCPIKLTPIIQFLKGLALSAREKQEKAF